MTVAGLSEEIVGTGFGVTTGTVAAEDVPPAGLAFTAVSESVPTDATSAAVSVTIAWVALEYEVERGVPFTLMTVVGTNPVPVTVRASDAVPVTSVAGETDAMVGAGLSISRVVAALSADALATMTARSAPLAI
jgi:hypothetical protein